MYRLIIVDDENYILEQMSRVFGWEDMGFSLVGCFESAEAALGFARENPVDVLLTDIQLGGRNGLSLAMDLRELLPDIEVVLLSAHSDFEYTRTALRMSAFDYLLKPVTHAGVSACFAALKDKLDARAASAETRGTPAPAGEAEASGNYRIQLVKQYIEKHVGDDISLTDMADLLAMNPAYFSRFFKRHTGVLFAEYLVERRMERAIELLRDPHNKVFEVCCAVGYFSRQNFNKRFRQHTGHTPNEYRNEVLKMRETGDEA